MTKKVNERLTEKLFEDYIKTQEITSENGWVIEYQKSKNPKLSFISKTGRGGVGSPEFIITKSGISDFVIVVEAKALTDKFIALSSKGKISLTQSNIRNYAINGAYHYAKNVSEDFNVLFIGCVGDTVDFQHKMFLLKKGETDYVEINNHSLFDLNKDFNNVLIEMIQLYNTGENMGTIESVKTEIEVSDDDAKNLAADIHELLRDHAGVPANQKPVLIAAMLLACDNPGFKMNNKVLSYSFKDGTRTITIESNDTATHQTGGINKGEIITMAAIAQAINTGMHPLKSAKLESSFKFIETHSSLNADKLINGEVQSTLNILCEIILGKSVYKLPQSKKSNLHNLIKQNSINDILGHFYSEFLSYGGSDGKDLGIILTPSHITSLMVDLVNFGLKDRLYDCCTGTAGFLVAGMSKVFREVRDNPLITSKEDILKELRSNAFIGCEVEDYMFTIAATNMILRGDGKSNLFIDSCFNIEETIKRLEPTCAVLNPPYSLKGEGLKELDFINHTCRVTKEGGLVAAIVPKSIFLDKNKTLRGKVLENNTLVAVITPPDDLFIENAGTQTAIGIFKAHVPHNPEIKTWLCQFDDGFTLIPKNGRIDQRGFEKLSKELITRFKNRETIEGYSKLVNIDSEMECLYDCHIDTEKPNSLDFKYKLKDWLCFDLKVKIEEVINE